MSALRIDQTSGLEERLELVDTPRGRLYTWSARPPDATSCVIVCSSMLADFTANYDRERAAWASPWPSGVGGVIRFHYAGEGNSDGERRDMTLSTMCDDADAVLDHAGALRVHPVRLPGDPDRRPGRRRCRLPRPRRSRSPSGSRSTIRSAS